MALLTSPNLLFLTERDDAEAAGYYDDCFFVGIYLAPSYERLRLWDEAVQKVHKRSLRRLFPATLLKSMPSQLDVDFVGGAKVCEVRQALLVQNIGAKPGYGPTLYACILELATARGLKGVVPTREPNKILPKPKEIWRQFAHTPCYAEKITTRPLGSSHWTHDEAWLNQIYTLVDGAELVGISSMRDRSKRYWSYWHNNGCDEKQLLGLCRNLAIKSVEAHQVK